MKIFLTLLLAYSLHAVSFWTLTGVEKAGIYVQNEVGILDVEVVNEMKSMMRDMLKKNSIVADAQDAPTLMLILKEISNDDEYYIHIQLALGEEVQTFRSDKSEAYALTYDSSEFIETDSEELGNDILESVKSLLSGFEEQYQDDKE